MSALLEIENVKQAFRSGFWMKQVEILHGISLSVPQRSVFGFLGANGAGKTTLIQLIVGLRKPTSGSIRVSGLEANTPAARARLGYLPERPYFYEHLTGEGFLKYFGSLSGMPRNQVLDRIPQVLTLVGMSHARKLELKRFSKGMLQRIGIAQAILHDPEFLVLDEPMSGLDPMGRKEIRELILKLAGEGRTIFFSSHVIPDVEAMCDQVALIQKGNLIGCGPIRQFLAGEADQNEIGFNGISIEDAGKLAEFTSLRQIPDGIRGVVSGQNQTAAALEKLVLAKAHVMWMSPIRPSLESMFGQETAVPDKRLAEQDRKEMLRA